MSKINESTISTKISCPRCNISSMVPLVKFKKNSNIKCPNSECGHVFLFAPTPIYDNRYYHDISPDAFMHPLDRKAVTTLKNVPGFDFVLRKMMEYGYEKFLRVNAMADDVKVSSRTCSYIYNMSEVAANCIGVSSPDVFINQNPIPNAYTYGVEYPMITLSSGLIELIDDDELFAVISHEMTHIKCHHVLYNTLANFLFQAAEVFGIVGKFVIPLRLALLEWSRKAELSADRGSLVITNNSKSTIKMLMKIAGGSSVISELIDESEFLSQSDQFENLTKSIGLNKFYKMASTIFRTHPFPALRANEIKKWSDGNEYREIFDGKYQKRDLKNQHSKEGATKCPHCGTVLENSRNQSNQCPSCGQNPNRLENQYDKTGFQSLIGGIKGGVNSAIKKFGHGGNGTPTDFKEKICPKCKAEYVDPDVKFCPADGSMLISREETVS